MQDRRVLISLVLGIVGGLAGIGGLVGGSPLALIAGVCALGAGLTPLVMGREVAAVTAEPTAVAPAAPAYVPTPPPASVPGPVVQAMPAMAPHQQVTPHAPMPAVTMPAPLQVPGTPLAAPAGAYGAQPPAPVPYQAPADAAGRADLDPSLIDPRTGLYTENYLMVALDARIAAARRRLRPVSVVMIDVVYGMQAGTPMAADTGVVAAAVRSTLREADTAACMNDGRFVLVLEDTPENGAIWTVERLRSYLVADHPDHTVRAGIACYPAHAFNLEEILLQANEALASAREWRQDRIEVASSD